MDELQKENLYSLLSRAETNLNSGVKTQPSAQFNFDIARKGEQTATHYTVKVRDNEDVLFELHMTKHHENEFKRQVVEASENGFSATGRFFASINQPIKSYPDERWLDFINRKNSEAGCLAMSSDYPYETSLHIQQLKISDTSTIDKILTSMDFEGLLEKTAITRQWNSEAEAVSSVLERINAKKRL